MLAMGIEHGDRQRLRLAAEALEPLTFQAVA
jgi:hypothetical protein